MNTSPAPDVDRVLHRMGRSAFDYRSFPNPVDEAGPVAAPAADAPEGEPPAGIFSLVGEALPEAFKVPAAAPPPPPAAPPIAAVPPQPPPVTLAPPMQAAGMPPMPAATPPMNPFLPPMQPSPAPPDVPTPAPRSTSLSHMFRVLSGHAGPAHAWHEAGAHEPGFPFRRR